MWHRLTSVFYWQGACAQIKEYLQGCDTCQLNKSELTLPTGLLQPLPIPTSIWSDISMDFVVGLPNFQGKSIIYVVVDRLSKYAYILRTARVESVGQKLGERDILLKQVRLKLSRVQNRMKQVYDKGHREKEFQLGDLVYVRLHPYRQHTVARRSNMKLAAKYYGPYKVVERLGEVAYKLELPQGSKVHSVFHVSLLKKQELTPQSILDFKGQDHKKEVLIHWCGHSPANATWEGFLTMQQQFPEFDLEDNDVF